MGVYVELFHGREHPDEELDEWGFEGPVLGPFPFFHMTYGAHYHMGDGVAEIHLEMDRDGLTKLFGSYYGDLSVFSEGDFEKVDPLKVRITDTKKILSTPDKDLPLLINDERPWVRVYVSQRLKGVKNGTHTRKPGPVPQ